MGAMRKFIAALVAWLLVFAPIDAAHAVLKGAGGTTSVTSIAAAASGEDSLTAFATGGQTSATSLSATVTNHRVTTVATAADSVKLPAATVGLAHFVRNDGANAMQVFGQATETINGVASATGISQGVGMGVWYVCTTAGNWTTSPVSTITATTKFLAPDGTAAVPSYSFASNAAYGFFFDSGRGTLNFSANTTNAVAISGSGISIGSTRSINWLTTDPNAGTGVDLSISKDASNTLAQKNGTTAQVNRLYFSTTGPIYFQQTARTAGVLFTGVGGAMQLSSSQTTVPTCSSNCGTSPSIVGSDTAGIVTMGASGVPASGWVVTFNGTWPAAPSCVVQSALAGMVVGKMPIVVATTTTTITVTTNGTAPATSDKYSYICHGVS